MTDKGQLLADACKRVVSDPKLAPQYDKKTGKLTATHCNRAALLVAQAMGCAEFDRPAGSDPLLADKMIALMASNSSGRWRKVSGADATIHALGGGLAFAAKTSAELGAAHGHIAAVWPVGRQRSDSWRTDVPVLANVGKDNGMMRASKAFPVARGEPPYFAWDGPA